MTGAIYVGQADGTHNILKFNLDCSVGTPASFSPNIESRGTDWISLATPDASDGGALCDMQYSSEGVHVLTFDICAVAQEANLVIPGHATSSSQAAGVGKFSLPGPNAFALRQLGDGSILVADTSFVVHLDSAGNQVSKCDTDRSGGTLFALNVLPGSNEFVTASIGTGVTDYFTIAHCDASQIAPDFTFNAIPAGCDGSVPCLIAGLTVFGEVTQSSSVPEFAAPAMLVAAVAMVAFSLLLRKRVILPRKA